MTPLEESINRLSTLMREAQCKTPRISRAQRGLLAEDLELVLRAAQKSS